MAGTDRESFFPAIEKKHGQPMSYWFSEMAERADQKYAEQIAFLKEEHGFSQAHANALVMYCKGSTNTRRFNSLTDYLKTADPVTKKTVKSIFDTIQKKYPKLELVIAWNQPMLKLGDDYVFGLSTHTKHILLAPWGKTALDMVAGGLEGYKTNKKTIQVPIDWQVDAKLLHQLLKARISEL